MICVTSSHGKITRIIILVIKVTWELQRNVDVIIPIKSDQLFKKTTFLSHSPIYAVLFAFRLLPVNSYDVQYLWGNVLWGERLVV